MGKIQKFFLGKHGNIPIHGCVDEKKLKTCLQFTFYISIIGNTKNQNIILIMIYGCFNSHMIKNVEFEF